MIRNIFISLCLLVATSTMAFAEEPLKIVVAHDATWPPMEFIGENRALIGYSVDYIDAIAKEVNISVEHKNIAWDGIFSGVRAKRYDVIASSVTITPQRKKILDFTDPYYEVKQAIVVPKTTNIVELNDMAGKKFGAQIGTTGFFAIKKIVGATAVTFDEVGLAMEALATGRVDGVVCDDPTATNYILANKEYGEKMKVGIIIPADEPEYYGFAVDKGNTALVKRLNKGIALVKQKGIEAELIKKWMTR